jgi:hypothetical protein
MFNFIVKDISYKDGKDGVINYEATIYVHQGRSDIDHWTSIDWTKWRELFTVRSTAEWDGAELVFTPDDDEILEWNLKYDLGVFWSLFFPKVRWQIYSSLERLLTQA